jgi:hypothetical protein
MIDLMNDFIFEAVANLSPNAIISHTGTINSITWISVETVEPTDAEITAEISRLQAVYDSQEYARARATEYSALNQFEMQFDDQQNNTTTWVDAINDIKARFPK